MPCTHKYKIGHALNNTEAINCFKEVETIVKKDDEGEDDKNKCTPCVCEYFKRSYEEILEDQPIIKEMFCSPGKNSIFILNISFR